MKNTILYIDPFSGVSGDMLLGAMLSAGVPLEVIAGAVEKVIPGEVVISAGQVTRSGLAGTKCDVQIVGGPGRRTLDEMKTAISAAGLDEKVASDSLEVLESLGVAESRAHGHDRSSGGDVHLHELGGQDTLADIVGVQAAVNWLGLAGIHCGSLNLGRGYVGTAHGEMPVPAPATAFLVEGMPVHSAGPEMELTTPTGAALVKQLATSFGSLPPMTVETIGVGAGTADHEGFPNLLRVLVGEASDTRISDARTSDEDAVIIECGVDDLSPEYLAPAMETIQAAGAKEVHLIPVYAKKGRPGILVRALVGAKDRGSVAREMLEATGSSGLRFWDVGRQVLPREMLTVLTPQGAVAFKRWQAPSGRWQYKPEYEDVKRLADEAGMPILEMEKAAVAAYLAYVADESEAETEDGSKKD